MSMIDTDECKRAIAIEKALPLYLSASLFEEVFAIMSALVQSRRSARVAPHEPEAPAALLLIACSVPTGLGMAAVRSKPGWSVRV